MTYLLRSFFLALLLLNSCDDYMNINKTTSRIHEIAKRKYDLVIVGNGIAAPDKIKRFILDYSTKREYSESEARKLIIDFTEDYIHLIANSPEVEQYFENYPVSERDAYILIGFNDRYGHNIKGLSGVRLSNGTVALLTIDEKDNYKDLTRESYAEAYIKVYGTQPPERT